MIQKRFSELTTTELYRFLKLRTDVFYVEQKVDESELDDRDLEESTVHYWLAEGDRIVAYLRVIEDDVPEHLDGRRLIGRVVVAADRRGSGLAQLLIHRVLEQFGHEALLLHAQSYISGLYAKFDFVPFGDEFSEAGIMHTSMYRAGIR
ncbi:GNAT family N-acetyltransferase [Subtercola boreus]|uniref:GNAT family N-acetyltransferase n=1 Tax=Subtercola boreus TaxID=120213 RepID=A0A3E0W8H2_9MICO|nr:GNAT family N-acetyltransferase [Subtercola boreus]RFA19753.1 GNAT family N-acetyltransferase [Subtercola boreus]RFA26120.1 GNAT family N-acetyltransferase [Subtercola boreus]